MFQNLRTKFWQRLTVFQSRHPGSIKILFFVLASFAILGFFIYTLLVMQKLKDDSDKVADTYASLYGVAISEIVTDSELNVIFHEIIKKTQIPIIITDTKGNYLAWKNVAWPSLIFNKPILPDDTSHAAEKALDEQLRRFKKQNIPKQLKNPKSHEIFGYLYYGRSQFLRQLSLAPFMEIIIILLFVFVGGLGLKNIQVSEQSTLWVALAKETAHQLGTPISSLMGWIELLRIETQATPPGDMRQCSQIVDEIERDIKRLNKVANRFGKIGSKPELRPCDINAVVRDVVPYFQNRLPNIGKQIELQTKLDWLPSVMVNRELIEWVLENMIKNAIDAIVDRSGYIKITTEYMGQEGMVRILHEDNGKGLSKEEVTQVFQMGYSTKPRGWGIGLALAKRIVEEYHRGRIYVYHSEKDAGTTFAVELPIENESGN